jgi:hypothetical protein
MNSKPKSKKLISRKKVLNSIQESFAKIMDGHPMLDSYSMPQLTLRNLFIKEKKMKSPSPKIKLNSINLII